MMNQRNLIIGAIVLIGGYYIYKTYYTKPKLPITNPIIDKGEPIIPTPTSESSFDFDADAL